MYVLICRGLEKLNKDLKMATPILELGQWHRHNHPTSTSSVIATKEHPPWYGDFAAAVPHDDDYQPPISPLSPLSLPSSDQSEELFHAVRTWKPTPTFFNHRCFSLAAFHFHRPPQTGMRLYKRGWEFPIFTTTLFQWQKRHQVWIKIQ